MGLHEEFLELCALSTSGDLTEEEQMKLHVHLAGCAECRQALREFETAVDVGMPLLSSVLSAVPSEESVHCLLAVRSQLSLNCDGYVGFLQNKFFGC